MKKILLTTVTLILFCIDSFGQPGTLDLTFNPIDLGQGISLYAEILDAKVQSDGKTIIVGSFTSYNSTSINRIARINIDGTLDLTFNPGTGPNAKVHTVSFQNDGKIIIGGDFTLFNGISRNMIARLNNDGSLDTTFNPGSGPTGGLSPTIMKSAIQNDGKIIVGGDFTLFNGISRNMIARLNNDGSLDTTFNPGTGFAGTIITSISLQIDSKIIIGGIFSSYNGISSKNIIRLNANATVDTSFNIGTGANSSIRTTSIQSDGKIIIGGDFTNYNAISCNHIVRLNTNGSIDSSFNIGSGPNNSIWSTTIQSDGKIIIGGQFINYNGVTKNNIARLNPDGSLDNVFNAESGLQGNVAGSSDIYCISILNSGKILIVGDFTFVNNELRYGIAILESTGVLSNINKGYGVQGGVVNVIKQHSPGKFIIGGSFRTYNGIRRSGIAMINIDGTLDLSFNDFSGITNGVSTGSTVLDIEIVGAKIIIVGGFNSYNGLSANRIIRLNSDGSIDNNFNVGTGPNNSINTITSSGDNKFLIGGNFTTYNGTSRNKIAKINYNGSLDIAFNPINVGNSGTINTIENLPNAINGRYIAAGNFTVNGINNIFLCGLTILDKQMLQEELGVE